jgi:hypothetical protein
MKESNEDKALIHTHSIAAVNYTLPIGTSDQKINSGRSTAQHKKEEESAQDISQNILESQGTRSSSGSVFPLLPICPRA